MYNAAQDQYEFTFEEVLTRERVNVSAHGASFVDAARRAYHNLVDINPRKFFKLVTGHIKYNDDYMRRAYLNQNAYGR